MALSYARRQLALRRLLLDGKGQLSRDACALVADFRNFCHGDKPLLQYSSVSGAIDPTATVAAAARREVFDRYVKMLHVEIPTILQARGEE